jgi:hypothetical protein
MRAQFKAVVQRIADSMYVVTRQETKIEWSRRGVRVEGNGENGMGGELESASERVTSVGAGHK